MDGLLQIPHEFLVFDTLRNRFSALLHEPSESLCLSVLMG